MKALILLLLTVTLTAVAFGQAAQQASAQVKKSLDELFKEFEQEQQAKLIRWSAESPNCDRFLVEGLPYRVIRNGDVTVIACLTTDDYFSAEVMVINKTNRRIDVQPQDATLTVWKDVKKNGETLTPLSPEKIARKLESQARWAAAFRSLGAAMATTQQTTTSSGSGNVSVYGRGSSEAVVFAFTVDGVVYEFAALRPPK